MRSILKRLLELIGWVTVVPVAILVKLLIGVIAGLLCIALFAPVYVLTGRNVFLWAEARGFF